MIQERDILNRAKPRETKNEFTGFEVNKSGQFKLHNERYRTRVRQSRHVILFRPLDKLFVED